MEARTTGLGPWTVWVVGIALSWATLGVFVAGLWVDAVLAVMTGGAMLYSFFEDHRGSNHTSRNHRPRLAPRTSGGARSEVKTL